MKDKNMKKVITVDFDETLAKTQGVWDGIKHLEGGILTPINEIFEIVFNKAKEGYSVWIVSFRSWDYMAEVQEFVAKHNLPITGMIATKGEAKLPFLQKLGSSLHIDDNVETILEAFENGINGMLVKHNE
jgi:FMN phosphatase YigB (HAD superfamily)